MSAGSHWRSIADAIHEWLAELEQEHGPVPGETLEWAARMVDQWEAAAGGRKRRAG